MRIGITDSGVGGLSVCAELEVLLRRAPLDTDVEIVYLNAALRDDYAYNAMPDRETKLRTFARFLENAYRRYRPDHLYIACNSLSVLFRDPFFDPQRRVPVRGIVRTGIEAMRSALANQPDAAVAEALNNLALILRAAGRDEEAAEEQRWHGAQRMNPPHQPVQRTICLHDRVGSVHGPDSKFSTDHNAAL